MAQQRNNKSKPGGKSTSFGKRSSAEKAFRGKKKSDSFGDERRASGPSDFKKTFRKSDERSGGGSFGARSEGPRKFSKPFRSEGGDERPFRKTGGSPSFGRKGSFGKPDGDFKRPFTKRGEDSFDSRSEKPGFSKPFRNEGGADKPFRKTSSSSGSFSRPGRFEKSDRPGADFKRPFKKRDGDALDSGSDKPRFSKSPRAEGGDEKPFRKTGGASGGFGRPNKFERPTGAKPYSADFKKSVKKVEGADAEKKEGFEKKSFGEKRPFIKKPIIRSAKSFKPKVWDEKPSDGLIRLNKYIANSGVCSRREADNLITMGLISVNKETITELGYKVKPGDQVRYEDKLLKAEKPVYLLLNKPKGFITTTDDPQERNTVMNLVASACKERIYPVGRLDRNTTGLLLLTNDGDLAEKLMHPSYNAKKIYKVELDKPITKNDFIKVQEGVRLPEGKAVVDELAMVSDDGKTVGVEIHIGWNRVVRRIFETLGYQVVRLDRTVYAGLDKKDLGRGEWRFLKPEEIVKLKHFKG